MPFRYRRRLRLGPLRFNVTENGVRSVAVQLGPLTYNFKTRKATVNLPGTGPTWSSK